MRLFLTPRDREFSTEIEAKNRVHRPIMRNFKIIQTGRAFSGFHPKELMICYSLGSQHHGPATETGELVIMNWEPAALGGLFDCA